MTKSLSLAIIILFTAFAKPVNGQNLIRNYSFEDIFKCPTSFLEGLDPVKHWKSYYLSSDYYNDSCLVNSIGHQKASDGVAYAGVYVKLPSHLPNYREYLGQRLSEPLIPGKCYKASFKVSLADSSNFGIKNLGMLLTQQDTGPFSPPNFAHITLDTYITDKRNWYQTSGSFIAELAYTDIVIGNFFSDEETDSIYIGDGRDPNDSYYYIDEITLELDTLNSSCPCKKPVSTFYTSHKEHKVTFQNYSTTSTEFIWDFGDGDTSTFQNPVHIYDSIGSYNVCLISKGPCGLDTVCKTVHVACKIPSASFTYSRSLYTYHFENQSSWADSAVWDFGDGTTSNDYEPDHIYSSSGPFEVCLVAINKCSSIRDTFCQDLGNVIYPIGIDEAEMSPEFSIFPNPASTGSHITVSSRAFPIESITLTNIYGIPIFSEININTHIYI